MARIVMAQLDFWVGDVAGNTTRLIEATREAHDRFAPDLVVFPELALTGYPPEDLLWRRGLRFIAFFQYDMRVLPRALNFVERTRQRGVLRHERGQARREGRVGHGLRYGARLALSTAGR